MSAADKTKLDNLDLSGLNNKLDKTTYEYNKEAILGSSNTVIKIGTFPCYDSNITIDISSTTSASYNGTLIIATQNVRAGSEGI